MAQYVRELVLLVCSNRCAAWVFGVEVGAVVAAEETTMNIPPWPGDFCVYFPAVFNSASPLSDETPPEVDNCLRIIAGKEESHLVVDECLLPDACPKRWRWRADDWSCEAHGVCCRSGGPEMQPVLRRDVLDRKRGEVVNWQAGLGACNHSSIFSPCMYILNLLPN